MITDPNAIDKHCDVSFYFADKIAAKRFNINAGDILQKHTHDYDHISVLGSGSVRVTTPQGSFAYDGGDVIIIEKNTPHQITALEDSVWICIHVNEE